MERNNSDNDFIMSPKIDIAFKEIMENPNVGKGFLSAVLNIKDTDIKKTTLKNTNMRVMHEDEKQSILDVRVLMNDDTEIDIEIQVSPYRTWANRSAFYLTRLLTEQTDINKTYSNIKKCIGINILDFNYTKDDRFYKSYHIREDKTHEIFTDVLEWHIIELPKLPAKSNGTSLYNWAKFINANRKEDLQMIAREDNYINEAYMELERISQSDQLKMAYDARIIAIMDQNTIREESFEDGKAEGKTEGIEIGKVEGRAEGIEEGIGIGEQKIINKLLRNGMSKEQLRGFLGTDVDIH